jgi:hypothetical protein
VRIWFDSKAQHHLIKELMLRALLVSIILSGCSSTPRGFDGNWSQSALRDGAADGCPGQYHQWTTGPDGAQWLTGCWGKK